MKNTNTSYPNHTLTDDSTNDVMIPALKIGSKYFVFCDCGEVIESEENPDDKFLVCDLQEEDYFVSLCKGGYCLMTNEICIPNDDGFGKCGVSCLKCRAFRGNWDDEGQ